MEKESDLKNLKSEYKKIEKKHSLPDFEELNKDFSIEKISESETEYILREIRKYIADKFSGYLRFLESLINPSSPPIFVYSIIKNINPEDNKTLKEIYKLLAKKEVKLIELDIQYVEEKEAQFIKDSFKMWQEIKKDLLEIVERIEKNWDNKLEKNGKNYFG